MDSTAYITLDLQRKNPATVAAKQNDLQSRKIRAQLRDGDVAFTPPASAAVMIRYAKPDGTAGWYDTLEDGSSAYSLSGSVLTFTLAEQALTVAGGVLVEINFYTTAAKLTTFTFLLAVEASVLTDREIESSDYFNVLSDLITRLLGATTHPPIIDPTTRNWLLWDESQGAYADSGYSSVGMTGPTGPTGPAATIVSQAVEYQKSTDGTTPPTGSWSSSIPAMQAGEYLWVRVTINFNSGTPVVAYGVSYWGVNGSGAVATINGVGPDGSGNVTIDGTDIKVSASDATPVSDAISLLSSRLSYADNRQMITGTNATKNNNLYFEGERILKGTAGRYLVIAILYNGNCYIFSVNPAGDGYVADVVKPGSVLTCFFSSTSPYALCLKANAETSIGYKVLKISNS